MDRAPHCKHRRRLRACRRHSPRLATRPPSSKFLTTCLFWQRRRRCRLSYKSASALTLAVLEAIRERKGGREGESEVSRPPSAISPIKEEGPPASATSIVRARGAAGDHGDAPKGRFTTQTRRRRWPKRGQAERARARSPPLPSSPYIAMLSRSKAPHSKARVSAGTKARHFL